MYHGIQDRVALVTGGAQGIGRAIAALFIEHGATVAILDNDEHEGQRTRRALTAQGDCSYFHADIADEEAVDGVASATVDTYGRIDFLVNCAAAFIMRGLRASTEDWRRMLDVNVMGYALCAKSVRPHMIEQGKGAIVNVSSISAFIAQEGLLTYSTTKAAVSHLTRLAAMELAPFHIRVNAVCPGTVWSDNNAKVIFDAMGLDRVGADAHPEIGGKALLKRTADPEEVAKAVLFLASDDASYITGENLVVDGGYTIV